MLQQASDDALGLIDERSHDVPGDIVGLDLLGDLPLQLEDFSLSFLQLFV